MGEFREFRDGLFYKLEGNGEVVIAGDRMPTTFSILLEDGSQLVGGISRNGDLFGERSKGSTRSQIRWHNGPGPDYELDLDDQPAREPPRPPAARPAKPASKAPPSKVREDNLEALREAAEALEQKSSLINSLEFEKADLAEQLQAAKEDSARLQVELAQLRLDSQKRLEAALDEAEKNRPKRRLEISTDSTTELPMGDLETQTIELIDDEAGKTRYIVTVSAPETVKAGQLKAWVADVRETFDKILDADKYKLVLIPPSLGPNVSLKVLEILPHSNSQDNETDL